MEQVDSTMPQPLYPQKDQAPTAQAYNLCRNLKITALLLESSVYKNFNHNTLRGKDHFVNQQVDKSIILKWILRNRIWI
jgi:hypothetical protein